VYSAGEGGGGGVPVVHDGAAVGPGSTHCELLTRDEVCHLQLPCYVRQVNGVKLADILFSLMSVCVSVSTHI